MTRPDAYRWEFRARFRRHAFGWRSQPAVRRVKEAVAEVKRVARHDPVLAAEGAVSFLERVSPALEHVDSSSGAIGTAVNHAVEELVPIIAGARVEAKKRQAWLERLWVAHGADEIPYIEILADFWGELCASKEVAAEWADDLVGATRMALNPDSKLRVHFHGTSACLSALFAAERYEEIVEILKVDTIWAYKRWAVMALAAMGKKAEAVRFAESCRDRWAPDGDVDAACEEILLSSGLVEEAYARYGLRANCRGTYLSTFRAVAKKYPHVSQRQLLDDLVATTPGAEAKWFAAAKEAGLYDEAIALASSGPCDPKTLARASRDFADRRPDFALEAGLLALRWLVAGYGYEVTSADVWVAYSSTVRAAENCDRSGEVLARAREIVRRAGAGGFVSRILGTEVGL